MTAVFDCPRCGKGIPYPSRADEVVRCLSCGAVIAVKFAANPAEVTAPIHSQPAPAPLDEDAPLEADEVVDTEAEPAKPAQPARAQPPRRPKPLPPRSKGGGSRILVLASVLLVGGLALIAVTAGAIYFAGRFGSLKNDAPVARGSPTPTTSKPPESKKQVPSANEEAAASGAAVLEGGPAPPEWSVPSGAPDDNIVPLPRHVEIDGTFARILNRQ